MFLSVALVAAVAFREPVVVPPIRDLSYREDVEVRLDAKTEVVVRSPAADAASWVSGHFKTWYGFDANVVADVSKMAETLGSERYRLKVEPGRIEICADGLQGVRYAMYTLRQVAERLSSGRTVAGYRLPQMTADDAPVLGWRGVHLCWFPEMKATQIEREIRLAAYYKFNFAVVETWGTFESERNPWLSVDKPPMTKAELKRLKAIADDLGITLVPGFNVFGHAVGARSRSGKHVTLDRFPEHASLFEPVGGWNWCLANPEATAVVKETVAELHEAFGNPPFFHIGCDEAAHPSCASCRAGSYAEKIRAHVGAIHGLLAGRGARCLIWRSMLLPQGDKHYDGYYPGPRGYEDTVRFGETLPRDVVVCDACYGEPHETYPMLEHFRSRGHDTVTCPWDNVKGIRSQAAFARREGIFGLLQTTWHHYWGIAFADMMVEASVGSWSDKPFDGRSIEWLDFATHWRQCSQDAGVTDFDEFGYSDNQSNRKLVD